MAKKNRLSDKIAEAARVQKKRETQREKLRQKVKALEDQGFSVDDDVAGALLNQVAELSGQHEYIMLTTAHWADIADYQHAPQIDGAAKLEDLMGRVGDAMLTCYHRFVAEYHKAPKICMSMIVRKSCGVAENKQNLLMMQAELIKFCLNGVEIPGSFEMLEIPGHPCVIMSVDMTPEDQQIMSEFSSRMVKTEADTGSFLDSLDLD